MGDLAADRGPAIAPSPERIGSVIHSPAASTIQPSGNGSPRRRALASLPEAAMLVAMSSRIVGPVAAGAA